MRESHAFFGAGKISRDRHKLRDTAFGFTLLKNPLFCCKNDDFSGTQNEMFGEKSRHICKNVPFWQIVFYWSKCIVYFRVPRNVFDTPVTEERYQHVSTTGGLKCNRFFICSLHFCWNRCIFVFAFSWNGCKFRLEKEVKTNVSCVSENFRRQL